MQRNGKMMYPLHCCSSIVGGCFCGGCVVVVIRCFLLILPTQLCAFASLIDCFNRVEIE